MAERDVSGQSEKTLPKRAGVVFKTLSTIDTLAEWLSEF
jgi:hypothetical protein